MRNKTNNEEGEEERKKGDLNVAITVNYSVLHFQSGLNLHITKRTLQDLQGQPLPPFRR